MRPNRAPTNGSSPGHPGLTRQPKNAANDPSLNNGYSNGSHKQAYNASKQGVTKRPDFAASGFNKFDNMYDDQILNDISLTDQELRQPVQQRGHQKNKPLAQAKVTSTNHGDARQENRMQANLAGYVKTEDKYAVRGAREFTTNLAEKARDNVYIHRMNKSDTVTDKIQSHAVCFKLYYKSNFGEELCVVGDIPELGDWKGHKHMLKWTEGHIWVSQEPLVTNMRHFSYKYRVLTEGALTNWERGVDRICQPRLLPEGSAIATNEKPLTATITQSRVQGAKSVIAQDVWETYTLRFTVFDPLYKSGDEMWLEPEAGSGLQPLKMQRTPATADANWLMTKYGRPVNLWQGQVEMQNICKDVNGQFLPNQNITLAYSYTKASGSGTAGQVLERQPRRQLVIQSPNTYNNTLAPSQPHWQIVDDCSVINGVLEKADGTFLSGFFFNEIGEAGKTWNIILGSYPLYDVDIDRMSKDGRVSAVLSLQSDYEIRQRDVNESEMRTLMKRHSMEFVRTPVEDKGEPEVYADELVKVCATLNRLLQKRHRVYVHCTAGQSRSTTLALIYLCLYVKSNKWEQPGLLEQDLSKMHGGASPNMHVVTLALQRHADFQRSILDRMNKDSMADEEARRRRELERRRLDQILRQEEQRLWQRREDYLRRERENERRRKLQIEEENRQRLLLEQKRRQKEEQERQRLIALDTERISELEETLRQLSEEEQEQIRLLRLRLEGTGKFEHFFVGDSMTEVANLSERDLAFLQDQLFTMRPVTFQPRKGNALEIEIRQMMMDLNLLIPIVHIRDTLYLVGDHKVHIERKRETVMANIGGGYQEFIAWLQREYHHFQRSLLVKMIQSRLSLEAIIDLLIEGKQVRPAVIAPNERQSLRLKGEAEQCCIERRPSIREDNHRRTSSRSPSRAGSAFGKSYGQSVESPASFDRSLRSTSPTQRKSRLSGRGSSPAKSPAAHKRKTTPRSTSPYSASTEASIQSLQQKYEAKRREIQRELDYTHMERSEHIKQGDQTVIELNQARYAYIHNKQH